MSMERTFFDDDDEDDAPPNHTLSTWYVHVPLAAGYAHNKIILFDAICGALQSGRYEIHSSRSPEKTPSGFLIEVRVRSPEPGTIRRAAYEIAKRNLGFYRLEMQTRVQAGVAQRQLASLSLSDEGGKEG